MAGPWERYQTQPDETGPWTRFAAPAAAPDPYRQAAIEERDRLKAAGGDTGAGLTRRLVQGASFGFGDELMALATTPLEMIRHGVGPGEGYDYAKARENLILEDARKDTGIAGTVAEAAGGVGSAAGLAKNGLSILGRLAPSASLGKRTAASAFEGALYGGAYGVGEGEGLEGRAIEGAKGATIGGIAGGAFPVVAQGAASGYRAIQNARAGREIAAKTGISPEVLRMMGHAFEADGTLGARGAANMNRAGAEAMLADAGPNARAILDTAIQRGGPGAVQAREAIAARSQRSAKDIVRSLDENLGKPQGVASSQSAVRQGTAEARDAAYEAAYSSPIDYSSSSGRAIESLIKNRVPASAIKAANELMRIEGHSSKQILAQIGDDGSVVFQKMPDVRQIDYITRGLNQVADTANGQGALGGQTQLGRAYQNLSNGLRDILRKHVPAYDNALNVASDAIRRSKAIEIGSKLFQPSMARDAVAQMVKGMTAAERTSLATGIRSNIDDAMARVTRTVMDGDVEAREAIKVLKDFSSRANKEKLAIAIGPLRAGKIFSDLERATKSFELRAAVTENSKTYARQAMDRRIKQVTQPGPIGKVAQGEPINALRRFTQVMTNRTPEKIAAHEDRIYSDVAKLLTEPRQNAAPIFKSLADLGRADAKSQTAADNLLRNLNRAQPTVVYPLSLLSLSGIQSR